MNGSTKARNVSSLINQNSGGGSKKAGLAYQVGRGSYTSVIMGTTTGVINNNCCSLIKLQFTANPNVKISRPVGSVLGNSGNTYWRIPK
jgi:hypothetical protein